MSTRLQTQAKTALVPTPSFTPVQSGFLQRRYVKRAEPATIPAIVHEVLRLSGRPLDPATRTSMETHFDHDFSRVRVHTGAQAAKSAQSVNALAYTVGRDVVFGAGQYAPGTSAGQRLLAHELTHVVQQTSASRHPTASHAAAERQADDNSLGVVAGAAGQVDAYVVEGIFQCADGVGGSATLAGSTQEKEGKTKSTTEASLKVKVPIWSGGKFGPISLLEKADLKLKIAGKTTSLTPDDPVYQGQLEAALTLAQLEILKLDLGRFGALSSGLKLSGSASGTMSTAEEEKAVLGGTLDVEALKYTFPPLAGRFGALSSALTLSGTTKSTLPSEGEPKGTVGGKLGGKVEYTSPQLPYYPYEPSGRAGYGKSKLGVSGSLSAEHGTTGESKLGAGLGLSVGYEWMSLYGVRPFVSVKLDLKWTQTGNKVESSQVTALTIGGKW